MLKKRLLTALVLIPITLLVLFFLPPLSFGFLTAFITLISAWEWSHLMKIKIKAWHILYLVILIGLLWAAIFTSLPFLFISGFIWWLCAIVLIFLYPRGARWWYSLPIVSGLIGFLILVPFWVSLNFIRNEHDGVYKLLFLLLLVWGADTSAYFVGKKWGHTKLAKRISPGKTWEGIAGALIFTVIYVLLAVWVCRVPYNLWIPGIVLGLVVVCFSVVGDLFESMMKRQAGVKDSSHLLPGHGGLLDRIDSLTAAAPIFALGTLVIGKFS